MLVHVISAIVCTSHVHVHIFAYGDVMTLCVQNLELTQDARAVRTYRDEIDILKERASRVDKFEAEITKYKEKLNELEFYKSRVDVREKAQIPPARFQVFNFNILLRVKLMSHFYL